MTERRWLRVLGDLFQPPTPEEIRGENESFAQILVDLGVAKGHQVEECLQAQARAATSAKALPELVDLLVDRGYLARDDAARSLIIKAAASPSNRFGRILRVHVLLDQGTIESWKAWHLDRKDWCLLKFPRQNQAGNLERLQRLAALPLAGVIPVFEAGQANGEEYVATGFVEGQPFSSHPRIDRKRLVEIVHDVAVALTGAHEAGLVHGDLHASSILVDRAGKVHVGDLGLVRPTGTAAEDVRALAGILYEALADRACPPAIASPRHDWPARVDAEMQAVLTKALGPKPEACYGSARELADELARWLSGKPVRARAKGLFGRLRDKLS